MTASAPTPKPLSSHEKHRRAVAEWWDKNPMEPIRSAFEAMRPPGGFGLLMIDPPWKFSGNSTSKPGRNVRRHYETAPLDWIKALPIKALAADDALIWLWVTNPMLDRAFEVLEAWGVRYSTGGHWIKTDKSGRPRMGGGLVLRSTGEPYLLGKIGRPKLIRGKTPGSFLALRREHSRKPDLAFSNAVGLMPEAPRIELFAREPHLGWAVWGNETEKFTKEPDHDKAEPEARIRSPRAAA